MMIQVAHSHINHELQLADLDKIKKHINDK